MTDLEILRLLADPKMRAALKSLIKQAVDEVLDERQRASHGLPRQALDGPLGPGNPYG